MTIVGVGQISFNFYTHNLIFAVSQRDRHHSGVQGRAVRAVYTGHHRGRRHLHLCQPQQTKREILLFTISFFYIKFE